MAFLTQQEKKMAHVAPAEQPESLALLLAASAQPVASGFGVLLELWSPPSTSQKQTPCILPGAKTGAATPCAGEREKEEDDWLYLRRAHPGDKSLLLALRWLVAYAGLRRSDEQANEVPTSAHGWGWSRERVEEIVLLALITRAALRFGPSNDGGGVLARVLPHVRAPCSDEAEREAPAWWLYRKEMADVALVREAEARVARMFEKLLVPINSAAHTCGWWPMQGWSAAVYITAATYMRALRPDGESRSGMLAEVDRLLRALGAPADAVHEQVQWVDMCREYIYSRTKKTKAGDKNTFVQPAKEWACRICAQPTPITFESLVDFQKHIKGRRHQRRAKVEEKKGGSIANSEYSSLPFPPPPTALPRWLRSMQVKDPKSGHTQASATPDHYVPFLHAREPLPVVDTKARWKLELLRGQQKPSRVETRETGRCGSDDPEYSMRFQHCRNPGLECRRASRRGCRNPAKYSYRSPHIISTHLHSSITHDRNLHTSFPALHQSRAQQLCKTPGCTRLALQGRSWCISCHKDSIQIGGNEQNLRRPLSDYDV
jgi:hypothetical protein